MVLRAMLLTVFRVEDRRLRLPDEEVESSRLAIDRALGVFLAASVLAGIIALL